MDEPIRGGCLCGAVRYVAAGAPYYAGLCFCIDCRRASGGGAIPFLGYPAERLTITGETVHVRTRSARGGESVRSRCRQCGSLVFGGIAGVDREHTLYAGTLDDPARFEPTMAIFVRDRPDWVPLPPGLALFETMPPA
jgi:hypothetical protein